jgi:integrase
MPRVGKGREVERNGRWYARLRYTGADGKRKDIWLPAKNKSHASELLEKKLGELRTVGERSLEGDKVKFSQLAQEYKRKKLIPAKYVGDRKVAGLKSHRTPLWILQTLTGHFGHRRIKSITHSDIEHYKLMRLDTPTNRGQRQIAGVNRELEVLRAMFRFAIREGWLIRSPFEMGEPLVSKADEVRRERILSFEEEQRLLEACGERIIKYKCRRGNKIVEVTAHDQAEKREHLRGLIIAALDTAMRRGELFKLRWRDIDFEKGVALVRAENSKTARARTVGMTSRLFDELVRLYEKKSPGPDDLVFGVTETVKKGWKRLCEQAKITDLRFHDLRHTAITRMVQTGIPSAVIMKVSGHTQMTTFQRYVNPDANAVIEVAKALQVFNAQQQGQQEQERAEFIN